MSQIYMDVDVALSEVPVNVTALIDDTDFVTLETAIAYNAAGMSLAWHFVTTAGSYTVTSVTPTTAGDHDWTNQGGAKYTLEIPASGGTINNDTEGFGWFEGTITGVLPFRGPTITFRAAALNDALCDGGDNLDVNVVELGGATQSATDLTSLAGKFTGITSVAEWLGLIAGKQTGDATARTEIRATGAGAGTFDETTDSQEALRDRGDAAWTTGGGGGGGGGGGSSPTVEEIRTEMDNNSTKLAAIVADTNELQTDDIPSLIAALNDPTAGAVADAVWEENSADHTTSTTFGGQLQDVYHADIQLTIDGANTQDEYTITWFNNGARVTSGITLPTIQVVKRSDGTDLIAENTPTEIGSIGSFKYDETSNRVTNGEAVLVLVGATIGGSVRTFSKLLGRDASS